MSVRANRSHIENREPTAIIEAINAKADQLKEVASALNEKIKAFEIYLSRIRGRVEAAYCGHHPDDEPGSRTLYLVFQKFDSEWKILWVRIDVDVDDLNFDNAKLLIDAPLRIKIEAVNSFPNLLESIEENQIRLIGDVKVATEQLGKFLASLPIKEGK